MQQAEQSSATRKWVAVQTLELAWYGAFYGWSRNDYKKPTDLATSLITVCVKPLCKGFLGILAITVKFNLGFCMFSPLVFMYTIVLQSYKSHMSGL